MIRRTRLERPRLGRAEDLAQRLTTVIQPYAQTYDGVTEIRCTAGRTSC
jgi:hypothetical protein